MVAIRREAWVLVSFTTVPPAADAIERAIERVRVLRSRSDQRNPHTSPRRAGRGQDAQQGAVLGIVVVGMSSIRRTSAIEGGLISR